MFVQRSDFNSGYRIALYKKYLLLLLFIIQFFAQGSWKVRSLAGVAGVAGVVGVAGVRGWSDASWGSGNGSGGGSEGGEPSEVPLEATNSAIFLTVHEFIVRTNRFGVVDRVATEP